MLWSKSHSQFEGCLPVHIDIKRTDKIDVVDHRRHNMLQVVIIYFHTITFSP